MKGKFLLLPLSPLFFLCINLPAQSSEIASPSSPFQRAIELRNQGQFDEAETLLKHALLAEPANPDIHFELGNLYAAHHDALKLQPQDSLSRTLLEKTAYEFKEVTALSPGHLPAYYNLGVVYKKLGKYEAAREQFRTVLEIDSRQAGAHVQLGSIYEEQGFFEDARAEYRRAKELDYGNENIDTLLQDLTHHEEEIKDRARQEASQRSYARHRLLQEFLKSESWGLINK